MTIKDTIEKENYIIQPIKGISMLPLLVQGEDLVLVEKLKEDLKLLDMVLFTRNDNTYVLHRILAIKKNYYLICGDNQNVLEKVYPKQIIGKVTAYYKKKRLVSIKDKEYLDYLANLELDLGNRIHLDLISKDIKDFISLVSSTINKTTIDQSDFDFKEIYKLAKKQSLSAFIFKSIDKTKCPKDIYTKFSDSYNSTLKRNLLFENELKFIFNKLDEYKIPHMLVKGPLIAKCYDEFGVRYSTDLDVLIENKDNLIKAIESLAYKATSESDDEIDFKKKPIYHLECHIKPFDDKLDYFNHLFCHSENIKKYEYKLSNEDFFAYFLAHMKKHDVGGAGLRFYIDFYYLDKKLLLNETKFKQILLSNNLYDYYLKVKDLTSSILINNDLPLLPLNLMFKGSVFGYEEIKVKNKLKEKGKFTYILSRLFPSPKYIYKIYPLVRKVKVLLPFGYLYRLLHINKHKDHTNELNIIFKK